MLFVVVSGYAMMNHELWGDEMHGWNIAKSSNSLPELVHNTRYEGHPPAWHSLLWVVSRFAQDVAYAKATQFATAVLVVFMIIFFSPFHFLARILMPFGYYFLFEYGILGRNYAIAVLPAFFICTIMRRHFRYKMLLYYVLLFLMANTHLLALPLAAGLHLYFLWWNAEEGKKRRTIVLHALAGIIIALPALYFIFPPAESQINIGFWIKQWTPQQLALFGKSPAWAFMPVPAWWKFNFWNSQFLMASNSAVIVKVITPLVSAAILVWAYFLLRKSKKSLVLFATSFVITATLALTVFGLSSARYAGFIYISFLVASWMYSYEAHTTIINKWLFNLLLLIQAAGGIFAVVQDIRFPFSNSYQVYGLLKEPDKGEYVVADYWALNAVNAYTNERLYCIDIKKAASFVSWGIDMAVIKNDPYRYCHGIQHFLDSTKVDKVYMISTASPALLNRRDTRLQEQYHVLLFKKREGAIDTGGNLYLYEITKRTKE
jgi:hypothetical protein